MEIEALTTSECIDKINRFGHSAHEKLAYLLNANACEVMEVINANNYANATELEHALEYVSQSNLAATLKGLKRSGVVSFDRVGIYKYYYINQDEVKRINRITAQLAKGYGN